jgi:hypothetical protein
VDPGGVPHKSGRRRPRDRRACRPPWRFPFPPRARLPPRTGLIRDLRRATCPSNNKPTTTRVRPGPEAVSRPRSAELWRRRARTLPWRSPLRLVARDGWQPAYSRRQQAPTNSGRHFCPATPSRLNERLRRAQAQARPETETG